MALIGDRATSTATLEEVEAIIGDGELAERVIETANNSMGQEISEFDIQCLKDLCTKTLKMFEFRKEIQGYLKGRMEIVAPNLTSLIGESIAAKLISHSGSLSTLSKYPASTIQILGAEKALFRALKQKTKTPKYGLLYNTTFIGRAIGKNKGKISRYLANKCAMAARLDNFLVNVFLILYSQLTNSVKNLRNRSREDLPDPARRRTKSKRMNNLWTRLWMSLKRRSFTSILNKSLENTRRNLKNLKRRSRLSLRKKRLLLKLKSLRKRRRLPSNDDINTQFKYSTFIISNILFFVSS